MLAANNFPKYLLFIPFIWSFIGMKAAFQFVVYHDLVMPIAALSATIWIYYVNKKKK
jgi:hypothetical protein